MKNKYILGHARKTGGLNSKGNTLHGIASAFSLDRDSEVLLPSAFEKSIPPFLEKNPILLWNHDTATPIGRVEKMSVQDNEVPFEATFADTPKAQEIKSLFKAGVLNAVSVGFTPLEWTDEPVFEGQKGATITEVELFELSAVSVPANRDAIAQMKSAMSGIVDDVAKFEWAKSLDLDFAKKEIQSVDEESDEDFLMEAVKRIDRLFGSEYPDGVRKKLDLLRLQLLPHWEPNTPNAEKDLCLDNCGLDEAISLIRSI